MKKLFIVLAMILVLTGCNDGGKKPSEPVTISAIETHNVDMSTYKNMNSSNHQFLGITPATFLELLDNNGNGIVYVGYNTCPVCNEAVPVLNEAAAELGVKVFYIDCYDELNPLMDYFDEFVAATRPILDVIDGEPVVLTPHVMTIVNGEFVDSQIGIDSLVPSQNEKDHDKVKERYIEMMNYFKVD